MSYSAILEAVSPTSIVLALVCVLIAIVYSLQKRSNVPPGPTGIPILGYYPFISDQTCPQQLLELKKKYGDVFSFSCVGQLYIHLGSAAAVREAHISKSECFRDRFEDFNLLTYFFANGVLFINGEPWKVLRKYFLQVLKERSAKSIKESLDAVIQSTIEDLKTKNCEPVPLLQLITEKCSHIMSQTLFGEHGVSAEKVQEMNEDYAREMGVMRPSSMLLMGNIARYFIIPFLPGYGDAMASHKKLLATLREIVEEHKSSYDEEHIRDIIDDYIKERNERKEKKDPTAQYLTDDALIGTCVQFIGDGVLSVAAFLCIFITVLVEHPEAQDKIYEELSEVVGPNRLPSLDDKSKLQYTNAFLLEALRTANFFPFFPSLLCTKETTVHGYRIPKGAVTVLGITCCHMDPEVYENPEKFDPTRFIAVEGKKRPELPVLFGVGKRACIGESFTMMQIFMFLTSLVKTFTLELPEDAKDETKDFFALLMSGNFKIVARPRSQN